MSIDYKHCGVEQNLSRRCIEGVLLPSRYAGGKSIFLNPQAEMSDCLSTLHQAPAQHAQLLLNTPSTLEALLRCQCVDMWVKKWEKTNMLAELSQPK